MEAGHIRDPSVIEAMLKVPRELFLPEQLEAVAYDDQPMPIGMDQTISAPHMVAIMCDRLQLEPGHRVLEIGTGSGYHAAVVAAIVGPQGRVTSVEFFPPLARKARTNLLNAGVRNVRVVEGDGAHGAPEDAPFDRIYLACAAPKIPSPLLQQLRPDGILLGPVGESHTRLVRMRRADGQWTQEDLGGVAFVPLRGEFGLR